MGPGAVAADTFAEEAAAFDEGHWVEADNEEYTWKLDNSSNVFEPFDEDRFCNDLPGDVLMVGDSMMTSHYESLTGSLKNAWRELLPCWYSWRNRHGKCPPQYVMQNTVCNGTRKIVYIRNDLLLTSQDDGHMEPDKCKKARSAKLYGDSTAEFNATYLEEMAMEDRSDAEGQGIPWDFPEILSRFKVFVINVGAHYQPDDQYTSTLRKVIDRFSKHPGLDKRYVFFRTTSLGLGDCEQMEGMPPFSTLKEAEDHYDQHRWYHSDNFQRQNEIAKAMFALNGFSIYDVYKPTMLNGHSGHPGNGDCLHYKLHGGPFGHWNRLFYNLIRIRARINDRTK